VTDPGVRHARAGGGAAGRSVVGVTRPYQGRRRAQGHSRILLRKELEGRLLSQVRLTRDVELVSLCGVPHLNAVQQSGWWLVESDPTEYAFTRRWGHWLRAEAGWADGFVRRSRLDGPTNPWSCSASRRRATCSR
jgi:hypothetical protein